MKFVVMIASLVFTSYVFALGDYTEVINEVESPEEMFDYGAQVNKKKQVKKFERPVREVAVIVTEEGYYPKKISVFKGEEVNFYVTSTINSPNCFIVAGKNVFLAAIKGKVNEAKAKFTSSGTYKVYCPSTKIEGKLVVLERNPDKKEVKRKKEEARRARGIARAHWKPKDYPSNYRPTIEY